MQSQNLSGKYLQHCVWFWFRMKKHIWYISYICMYKKNVLFEHKNKRCHKRSYASFLMENEFVRTLSRNENWRIAFNKKSHVVVYYQEKTKQYITHILCSACIRSYIKDGLFLYFSTSKGQKSMIMVIGEKYLTI